MARHEYKYTLDFEEAALKDLGALPKTSVDISDMASICCSVIGLVTSKNSKDTETNTA